MNQLPDARETRIADSAINPIFIRRWSPRALSGEPSSDEEMLSLFEAARWAPSSYNEQEWRFLCGRRDTPEWPLFFDLLAPGNQAWCVNAAMLVLIAASKNFGANGKPNPVHLFDVGAAWENLALQATSMGLVAHGMQGFDFAKAREILHIPVDFDVAAMFAIGRPGDPADLPETLRAMEVPSGRRPARESFCEGVFAFCS
jgi:nitroreductase